MPRTVRTKRKRTRKARPSGRRPAKAPPRRRTTARRPVVLPVHRIEVALAADQIDPAGRDAAGELAAAGVAVTGVRVVRAYFLEGRLSPADLRRAAEEVL